MSYHNAVHHRSRFWGTHQFGVSFTVVRDECLKLGNSDIVLFFYLSSLDQPINTRLLVEKDSAVQVDGNGDGSFWQGSHSQSVWRRKKYRAHVSEADVIFGDDELHQDYHIGRTQIDNTSYSWRQNNSSDLTRDM
ncbi:hypothetical protein OIU76_026077 [Salix suchowensis]|uniref:Uncharacterized protein n=1 Tax=Salix suchowensis TaxID=1278906 RepID=A0ABQ9AGU9_9ROSI|nr:hypothetical protein OIU77_009523 [Salix suchowensis]KAJ6377040.1 hypothetical protein OIU76_026077 [Salix suchowensis]